MRHSVDTANIDKYAQVRTKAPQKQNILSGIRSIARSCSYFRSVSSYRFAVRYGCD